MQMGKQPSLTFVEAVRTALRPFLDRYGFVQVEEDAHMVRFKSSTVAVSLFYQPYSYELDLSISRNNCVERQISLHDIVEESGDIVPTLFQTSSHVGLAECITSIVQLLGKYGDAVLRGDIATFDRIRSFADDRNEKLTENVVNNPIRKDAEAAWNQRNFGEVKRLYQTIRGDLTDVELMRLNYATKHLK